MGTMGDNTVPLLLATVCAVLGDGNFTLLNLPINLTAWRISLDEAFNRPLVRPLATEIATAFNETLSFLRNSSANCILEGEECIPGVPSCCSSGSADEEDLQCLPYGDVYRCGELTDPEDLAQQRIDALEYGNSMGELESRRWINSWEYQSKSETELEELQARQEADWKKHWKASSQENFWLKTYKKAKSEAIDFWKDLKKMKKLKEVKDSLIDKKNKRLQPEITPTEQIKQQAVTPKSSRPLYPDILSGETDGNGGQTKTDSEESVIKFSDEVPKREKNMNFRLDDIIKYALDLVGKNKNKGTKEGEKQDKGNVPALLTLMSEEEPLHVEEYQGTVDKLMKEINELKELKKQQEMTEKEIKEGVLNTEDQARGPNIEELIKKHVATILDEERRLQKYQALKQLDNLERKGKVKA